MNIEIDGLPRVAPLWSKALQNNVEDYKHQNIDGVKLNLGSYSFCIVGEAWGFREEDDTNYDNPDRLYDGCKECERFANDLYFGSEERLSPSIEGFVKHFEKKHKTKEKEGLPK